MKTTILTVFVAFAIGNANAQRIKESEVPAAVISSFQNNFKGIKAERWGKESGNYEAEFDLKDKEASATFAPDGKWIETEVEIPMSEMPKAAAEYIAKNYDGKRVRETAKITTADGKVKYEAEIRKQDLLFDENGNLLK